MTKVILILLASNAALNRQAGAAIALCDNAAKRNDRTKQAPRRTVRVEVPCYVFFLDLIFDTFEFISSLTIYL